MTEQGERWAAVRSALQCAGLLQRGDLGTEPASYVKTGVRTTFDLMVSTFWSLEEPNLFVRAALPFQ